MPIRHKTAAPVGAVVGAIVGAGAAALAGGLTGAGLGASGGLSLWTQRVAAPSAESVGSDVPVGVTVPIERATTAAEILRRAHARFVQTSEIDRSGRPVSDTSGEAAELLSRPVHEPVRETR